MPNESVGLVITGPYELLANCLYVTLYLILPVILTVNHKSPLFLSLATIPLIIFCKGNLSNITFLDVKAILLLCIASEVTFNPAALYALWYVHGSRTNLPVATSQKKFI